MLELLKCNPLVTFNILFLSVHRHVSWIYFLHVVSAAVKNMATWMSMPLMICVWLVPNDAQTIPDVVYNDTDSTVIPNNLAANLTLLWVYGTNIIELHMEQFETYQDMKELHLQGTPVAKVIPTTLRKTPALKIIYFINCPLTEPPNFGELMAQLEYLEISGCGQSDIPGDYFDDFVSLKSLTLRENGIHTIKPDWFVKIAQLQSIVFSGNPIFVVPPFQLWLPKLKRLNLNYIETEYIPESLLIGLPHLEKFGMEGNKLTSIPGRAVFEPFADKKRLNFRVNPLKCQRQLCWLKVSFLKPLLLLPMNVNTQHR